jgi:hypothetical protein
MEHGKSQVEAFDIEELPIVLYGMFLSIVTDKVSLPQISTIKKKSIKNSDDSSVLFSF